MINRAEIDTLNAVSIHIITIKEKYLKSIFAKKMQKWLTKR